VSTGELDYEGPWWVYVIDREARVVWYHEIPGDRTTVMSRVSADGTHLTWGEVSWFGEPSSLVRSTLDQSWTSQTELPLVGYTYDELPDGTIAYDSWTFGGDVGIRTVAPDGTIADVWSCTAWAPPETAWGACGTNTVNYDEARGTYLWSLYDLDTIVEVDPTSGQAVAAWGSAGTDPLLPEGTGLQMAHYPNWTADGTLLVHTQAVGDERVEWAREFTWDQATGALQQLWSYNTVDHYADCSGEAVRVDGSNTLLNYGCEGTILEITPQGEVVWEVAANELIGHQTLIEDLYAVNRGW
jgi:hypothetical protein